MAKRRASWGVGDPSGSIITPKLLFFFDGFIVGAPEESGFFHENPFGRSSVIQGKTANLWA